MADLKILEIFENYINFELIIGGDINIDQNNSLNNNWFRKKEI